MNVKDFIDFNNQCPICNKTLTLYMQINNSALLKSELTNNNYHFTQFLYKDNRIADNDKIILSYHDNKYRMIASSSIRDILKDNKFFLFYLCNEEGFVSEFGDYHISLYHGCYHRRSPDLKLEDNIVDFCDKSLNKENSDESFCIVTIDDDKNIEKVFGLIFNNETDSTIFYFYSSSKKERAQENFEPKIFEKNMPLLPTRPSFTPEGKEKLIQKMESWIMMS